MSVVLPRLAEALADRYRLERELGQGGMATVYLAQDLKHDRKVAIKVLRAELAAVIGAERFLSEIKTTANLQHPHILALHDSGEADSFLYYVMPFIEGESLRDRLTREKQRPINDAVRIATEGAGALDYAHRHGVIHRDIKPENILLHDGRALVADFGIALAASKAGGTRMTETGMSLGTPHYMSPEQAMGEREITARSDVYALGAVTYEMLLGEPPFTGPTAQAIVAKVMTAEPASVTGQRKTVPPHVEAAVFTALEKLPADRFATAAEFAAALAGGGTLVTGHARPGKASAGPGPWRAVSAVLGVVVLALVGLAAWNFSHRSSSAGPAVFDAALPDSATMTFAATTMRTDYGTPLRNLAVSPDGSFAVYASARGDSTVLWYRSLRDATAYPIAGTRGGLAPRVSPEGSHVAFLVGGRVMIVTVQGGEARRLFDSESPRTLEWIAPGTLLLMDRDGGRLSWLDRDAGLIRTKSAPRCVFARWVAESRRFVCGLNGTGLELDPETGERWPIRMTLPDGSAGGPLPGSAFSVIQGHYLAYISPDGDLRAARYDSEQHLVGRPATLLTGVRREAIGDGQYDLTANGALVYAPGPDATVGWIVKLRRGGIPDPLPVDPAAFQRFDLSRDGRWLAAVVQTDNGQELRIHDLRDGQRQTWLRAEYIRHPLWDPSGDTLMVGVRDSTRWTILRGSPGSGRPDTIASVEGPVSQFDPMDYNAGNLVVAQDWTTFVAAVFDPSTSPVRFDTVATDARFTSLSPDGRLLAYAEENNRLVVTAYPRRGRLWQVASAGVESLWMSATELLYRSGVSWYLARLNPATGEPLGAPTFWARDPRFSDTSGWSNRPSHDGGIIYLQGPEQVSSTYLRVIPNWVVQMKAAVDAAD